MTEAMVRVVSVICPVCGERPTVLADSLVPRSMFDYPQKCYVCHMAAGHGDDGDGFGRCAGDCPSVIVATEPVEGDDAAGQVERPL